MQGVGQKGRVTEMKEHPAQVHHEKCVEPAQDAGEFVQDLPQPEFLDHQQDAVIQAPEQKVPSGSVPEAGEAPDDENIPHPLGAADPTAPQRDVDVIPKPGGEGDMPPPPKLRGRAGEIGVVEVLQEVEKSK